MIQTWYVMEDGSCADPREIAGDANGVLRHKDGRAVAYRPDGVTPRSRGVDVTAEQAATKAPAEKAIKPDHPKRYKTRETKAD